MSEDATADRPGLAGVGTVDVARIGAVAAVAWVSEPEPALLLIDQTLLPGRSEFLRVRSVDVLVDAITRLAVRGAPALGATGAFGVVVAMDEGQRRGWTAEQVRRAVDRIRTARPTAVNLAWGVDHVAPLMSHGRDAVLAAAQAVRDADEAGNRAMSRFAADWLFHRLGPESGSAGLRVLTHCNTGSLATTGWGTGLGVIREIAVRGRLALVYADETRPLLQGSRLTAWELESDGLPYVVQADGAAASTILRGLVDVAVIGADRIARNADTANKVGSLGVALACREAGIPFVVAAPWSTIDLHTPTGADIEIEERSPNEVTAWGDVAVAPAGASAYNPAFDVTPARLISVIVTERGVIEPDTTPDLAAVAPAHLSAAMSRDPDVPA